MDDAGPLDVGDKFYHGFREVSCESPLGNLPHFYGTVLRTAGYDIIVVGTEGDIKYWALVTIHYWLVHLHTASL